MAINLLDPQDFEKVLEELLYRGFEAPFYFSAIAVNGAMIAGCYRTSATGEGLDCEILWSHTPSGTLLGPVNMMFVDGRGEAARVTLATSSQPRSQPARVRFTAESDNGSSVSLINPWRPGTCYPLSRDTRPAERGVALVGPIPLLPGSVPSV